MQKSMIFAALALAFGSAQAQTTVSDITSVTSGASFVNVGGATIGGFHGPIGAPGIGEGPSGPRISLQSIEPFFGAGTVSSEGIAFNKYQMLAGFQHTPEPGAPTEPTDIDMNGVKVPLISKQVYFGLASKESATPGTFSHQAWYVGDQDGYAVPTATTNYAAVAQLGLASTDGANLAELKGVLQYDAAANVVKTIGSHLTNGTETLQISNAGVYGGSFGNVPTGTGTGTVIGTGSSAYSGSAGSGTGTVKGAFFGSGSTSALAGVAQGTSGAAYTAAFGGINKN